MPTLYKQERKQELRSRLASRRSGSHTQTADKESSHLRSGVRSPSARAAAQGYQKPDSLAVSLLPLVRRVACQMLERLPRHADLDDLEAAGIVGLLNAVRKFDARRHVKIETYARHRIRGAILDSLRQMDSVSRDVRQKSRNAEKVYHHLQSAFGRPVGDDEMASALGVDLTEWYQMVQELNGVDVAWMRPNRIPETKAAGEASSWVSEHDNPFELCYRSEQRALLHRASAFLPEKERMVITLYYERDLTMKEAGHKMGVKESRVSQIHRSAITRLKANIQRLTHQRPSNLTPFCPENSRTAFLDY
ncbi:MAG: sigma-70 family RNA polymerase sigma factor [Terriglobia bacterium]